MIIYPILGGNIKEEIDIGSVIHPHAYEGLTSPFSCAIHIDPSLSILLVVEF